MTELGRLAASGVPEWIGLAITVLGILISIARQQRRSAQSQGERLGTLERKADQERIRRQQVESTLRALGVDLSYWPPDGPHQPVSRPMFPADVDDLDDVDDYPLTTAAARPPVPPFTAEERERLARHRRG